MWAMLAGMSFLGAALYKAVKALCRRKCDIHLPSLPGSAAGGSVTDNEAGQVELAESHAETQEVPEAEVAPPPFAPPQPATVDDLLG